MLATVSHLASKLLLAKHSDQQPTTISPVAKARRSTNLTPAKGLVPRRKNNEVTDRLFSQEIIKQVK